MKTRRGAGQGESEGAKVKVEVAEVDAGVEVAGACEHEA